MGAVVRIVRGVGKWGVVANEGMQDKELGLVRDYMQTKNFGHQDPPDAMNVLGIAT